VGIQWEYHGFTNLAIYPEVENQTWRDAGKSPNHETMCCENHLQEIVHSKRVQFHYPLVISHMEAMAHRNSEILDLHFKNGDMP
jgi:hypothetical protein